MAYRALKKNQKKLQKVLTSGGGGCKIALTVKREHRAAGVFANTHQRRGGAYAHTIGKPSKYIEKYHYTSGRGSPCTS